ALTPSNRHTRAECSSLNTAEVIHLQSTVVLPEPGGPTNTCVCCRSLLIREGRQNSVNAARTADHSAVGVVGGLSPCFTGTRPSKRFADDGSNPSASSQVMLFHGRVRAVAVTSVGGVKSA